MTLIEKQLLAFSYWLLALYRSWLAAWKIWEMIFIRQQKSFRKKKKPQPGAAVLHERRRKREKLLPLIHTDDADLEIG